MSFEPAPLFVSFLLGSIGFVGFVYGKRMGRIPHMAAGSVLLIFPFFIENAILMGGIGAAVIAVWILAVRFGL